MDSSTTTTTDSYQLVAKKFDSIFPDKKSPHCRRTPSFSSLSSSSSSSSSLGYSSCNIFPDESPLSPATPLRFSGKPFSWEHLPGVPKKNTHKKKESILNNNIKQLPLPPPTTHPTSSKKHQFQDVGNSKKFSTSSESFRIKDPFVAALVECSKDDDDDDRDHQEEEDSPTSNFWSGGTNKVARSISDRFGFVNLYTSCKRTSAVSESIVYLPRPTRSSYDLISRRPRRI
ncbi:hypothetical protein ACOSQ3_009509 [Xanthoceras sorbifolium]